MRIHTKFTLLFFGLILLPLVLTRLIFVTEMHRSLYEVTMDNLENLTVSTSKEIERIIAEGRHDILVLSRDRVLQFGSRVEKIRQLNTTHLFYELFDEILILDLNGEAGSFYIK